MKNFLPGLSNLIYPNLCFQCSQSLCSEHKIFCKVCWSYLEWANPKQRCKRCFQENCNAQKNCQKSRIYKKAFVFNYENSAATWIHEFKNNGKYYLAESAGAFLAWQFLQLDWPKPDLIVATPSCFIRNWKRGYQASQLMANTMADILQVKSKSLLKKSHLARPQTSLNRKERMAMKKTHISLRKNAAIQDLNVLLIDDVMTTGTSMERSAQALQEGYPKSIYAMSFAYTDHSSN